ncbi:MAG: hypothetical protein HUU02_15385 [Bacteroidetes bacterium]|nr:hypothetical protein [Bacteroidota bacterium]
MRYRVMIAMMLMAAVQLLPAQQSADSTRRAPERKQRMLDENGDGVADRQQRRTRDRFIDANGDGVCDSREGGTGFRRGKNRGTDQNGKQQQRGKR